MAVPMSDLVAKTQESNLKRQIISTVFYKYRYHGELKTISQLAKIAGINPSTLYSRFRRGTYASVEDAVDTPVQDRMARPGRIKEKYYVPF